VTVAATGPLGPIVHVVAAGEVGGAERMLVRLARADAAVSGRCQPRRHVVALWTDDAALRALFTDAGLRVLSPPRPRGPALSAGLRVTGGPDVGWLASCLLDQRAAAVQLHTVASHVLGTRAGLQARVPIVRTEHSRRAYDNWLCRPFSAWSLRRATRIVTVSEDLGRLVTDRFPFLRRRLTVIHNGVPFPAVAAPRPAAGGPIRFVLVARLEPRKAIDRALRAVAAVPGARLDIVGDGPLRADLERIAEQLALGDRVRFWGYLPDPETVVAQADAAICSSTVEGLPLGLLEAMALALPVVAIPVGGVPEIVGDGDTGWLAAHPTLAALTVALRAAVAAGRPELHRRGERARASVERHFTEHAMRRAYEEVYAALPAAFSPPVARALRSAGRFGPSRTAP
jgi:glycosyltransferase involved in cell wall biosynthesis